MNSKKSELSLNPLPFSLCITKETKRAKEKKMEWSCELLRSKNPKPQIKNGVSRIEISSSLYSNCILLFCYLHDFLLRSKGVRSGFFLLARTGIFFLRPPKIPPTKEEEEEREERGLRENSLQKVWPGNFFGNLCSLKIGIQSH